MSYGRLHTMILCLLPFDDPHTDCKEKFLSNKGNQYSSSVLYHAKSLVVLKFYIFSEVIDQTRGPIGPVSLTSKLSANKSEDTSA